MLLPLEDYKRLARARHASAREHGLTSLLSRSPEVRVGTGVSCARFKKRSSVERPLPSVAAPDALWPDTSKYSCASLYVDSRSMMASSDCSNPPEAAVGENGEKA